MIFVAFGNFIEVANRIYVYWNIFLLLALFQLTLLNTIHHHLPPFPPLKTFTCVHNAFDYWS